MWTIGLKSGIITFLGLIAYGLLLPSLGTGLEYVVLALGIYSGHYYYKASNDGLMSYRQGLQLGLIVSAFTGFINGFIIYLYTQHADPSWIEQLSKNLQNILQKKGVASPMIEEVGQLMQHMSPAHLGIGIFLSTVLLGFALTLVVTAFSKSSQKTTSQEE